ncbi:hypothetical protein nbrc107696_06170 [Gordonia spumicola]|uniref:Uncharacterized protein n=2 Tax=Gordonia spumicola TaxID=589161 RepID=A0A7I9V577_9ACTN|nr:hypothetical protein nbrc107696_06170 [Gordonia spumicola]
MPPLPWADLGSGALLAAVVVMILRGWLIPRRTHDREIRFKDEQIVELKRKSAADDDANAELLRQNGMLLDAARTGTAVAESVQRLFDREPQS